MNYLAVVFPHLLFELSEPQLSLDEGLLPQVVVLTEELKEDSRVTALCPEASKAGVYIGQKILDARALARNLRVQAVGRSLVLEQLSRLAEVCQAFGTQVSIDDKSPVPQTIWINIRGVAHLFRDESTAQDEESATFALMRNIHERMFCLGHQSRIVAASGPLLAQAQALHQSADYAVFDEELFLDLPLTIFSHPQVALSPQRVAYFGRLGIFSLRLLNKLPLFELSVRLGERAVQIIELLHQRDRFVPPTCSFPEVLEESAEWESGIEESEPLLHIFEVLLRRFSARLEGRALAATQLRLEMQWERSCARQAGIELQEDVEIQFSQPLFREEDLFRVLKSRVEKWKFRAPLSRITLRLQELVPQKMRQTSLKEGSLGGEMQEIPPVLLAELEAELGKEGLGTLALSNDFLVEGRSTLLALTSEGGLKQKPRPLLRPTDRLTRLFNPALKLPVPLEVGQRFFFQGEVFQIQQLYFAERLEGIFWWKSQSHYRDYLWGWAQGRSAGLEVLFYIDRKDQSSYLQGLGD